MTNLNIKDQDLIYIGQAFVKVLHEHYEEYGHYRLSEMFKRLASHIETQKISDAETAEILECIIEDQKYLIAKEVKIKRVEEIVKVCFPQVDKRRPDKEWPLRHPAKPHWWNAACIDDRLVEDYGIMVNEPCINFYSDGHAKVSISSYVGGDEREEYELHIPPAWFEDDYLDTMHTYFVECIENDKRARANAKLKNAERALAEAQKELEGL